MPPRWWPGLRSELLAAQAQFGLQTTFAASKTFPEHLTTADFNGDDKSDALIAPGTKNFGALVNATAIDATSVSFAAHINGAALNALCSE